MFVEMGPDRLHHRFWKFHDKNHHLYEPDSKYENTIRDYYKFLDRKIGELLQILDKDTTIIVVSDHGAKNMKGAFCINEWLIKKGYLKLKKYPEKIIPLGKADINWKKTKAWAWGGYYSRIFLNVKGREPFGTIPENQYESFREKLRKEIKFGTGWEISDGWIKKEEFGSAAVKATGLRQGMKPSIPSPVKPSSTTIPEYFEVL